MYAAYISMFSFDAEEVRCDIVSCSLAEIVMAYV